MRIDVSELLTLSKALQLSSGRVGPKVSAALRKTAKDIEADAKSLAPTATGALRDSITSTVTGDGRFGSMTAEIGPTSFYGGFQEEGTSVMAPTPYLRPAFDRRAPGLEKAFGVIAGDIL